VDDKLSRQNTNRRAKVMFICVFRLLSQLRSISSQVDHCDIDGRSFPYTRQLIDTTLPYSLDQSVKITCSRNTCKSDSRNGTPYSYCQFSKTDAFIGGNKVTMKVHLADRSRANGIAFCTYSNGYVDPANTDLQIDAFCSKR
jgi:hypothetical protein